MALEAFGDDEDAADGAGDPQGQLLQKSQKELLQSSVSLLLDCLGNVAKDCESL